MKRSYTRNCVLIFLFFMCTLGHGTSLHQNNTSAISLWAKKRRPGFFFNIKDAIK